jgi:hypothetical protein
MTLAASAGAGSTPGAPAGAASGSGKRSAACTAWAVGGGARCQLDISRSRQSSTGEDAPSRQVNSPPSDADRYSTLTRAKVSRCAGQAGIWRRVSATYVVSSRAILWVRPV